MSATHRRTGTPGVKLRFTRSGAGEYARSVSVRWYGPSSCEHRIRTQPGLSHQPRDALPSAPHAQRSQLKVNPRSTVGFTAICVDTDYLLREHGVCPSPSRRQSISPTIEAALGDLQRPAHRAHPVVCLLCLDECVDHLRGWFSSLTKNHAAFFSISRSSLRTFTSLRRRRSSSFSSAVRPSRSPASISAWLTHLRSVSAETSRSRAIFATGYFSSQDWTSRMASSLNSGE